jgi:putative PIG3 family NAD(P)H quinone oxidoreductase
MTLKTDQTMRAVVVREPGGVEALEVVEMPRPQPAAGELLVRNFATALNRADLLQRRGLYPPPPGAPEIPGLEFAGEVAAVGEEVEGFRRGDGVFGLLAGGGYAEFLTVDQRLAVPLPETLSFDAAAAIPEAFYVAQEALFDFGKLRPGDAVLVHAGASGVGTAAIQLARARGVTSLATVGTDEKAARCLELGADRAVNYRRADFREALRDLTDGRGVDAILDLVGSRHWGANLESLKARGRLVVVGLVSGQQVALDLGLLLRKRIEVIGTVMRGRSLQEKIAVTQKFTEEVLPLLVAGTVKPVLDRVFPLEEVRQAHEHMEANRNVGKIVLRM